MGTGNSFLGLGQRQGCSPQFRNAGIPSAKSSIELRLCLFKLQFCFLDERMGHYVFFLRCDGPRPAALIRLIVGFCRSVVPTSTPGDVPMSQFGILPVDLALQRPELRR
jgi:hypothetical protein